MTTIHERIQKMIACGEGKGPRSVHESYEMELVKPILEREVKQGIYIYNDALCAVPDLVSGTRTKILAGHERLAGHGGHGGRGALELRHGFRLPYRGGVQRLHQERQPLGDWRGVPAQEV